MDTNLFLKNDTKALNFVTIVHFNNKEPHKRFSLLRSVIECETQITANECQLGASYANLTRKCSRMLQLRNLIIKTNLFAY